MIRHTYAVYNVGDWIANTEKVYEIIEDHGPNNYYVVRCIANSSVYRERIEPSIGRVFDYNFNWLTPEFEVSAIGRPGEVYLEENNDEKA